MAKKSNRKKRTTPAASPVKFDDSRYGDVRFSATYQYSELELYQAAAYLGGRMAKTASYLFTTLCLVIMVGVILVDSRNLGLALVLLFVSILGTSVTSNWKKMQIGYARNSTLDPRGVSERRHVVVSDSEVYVACEDGAQERYPLAELKRVYQDDEGLVASFGKRRFVYVPAHAMSAARFRELADALAAAK